MTRVHPLHITVGDIGPSVDGFGKTTLLGTQLLKLPNNRD